jgi:serine/threonine protein kinase
MEFVDGPNLHELVKERGPLPVGQAADFVRQAALGLQYAHEMGMVHRDIKPANLLVHGNTAQTCIVKILDFGLARLNEPVAPAKQQPKMNDSLPAGEQQVMGTPDYLSPEQARDVHSVDIRSDLYSLGCTLYFLLAGRVPFPGGSPLDKLVRHVSEEPAPIQSVRADLPPEMAAIVTRLMAKNPADRFQTPMELSQALAMFAVQGPAALPAHVPAALAAGPGSGDSPWANIFDDDSPATMRSEATVAPIQQSVRLTRGPSLHHRAGPATAWRVLQLGVIAAAGLVGFLLGAGLLAAIMR